VLCAASSMFCASDYEAVDPAGELGGDRRDAGIAPLGELGGGAGGVDRDDRGQPVLALEVAGLPERVDMAAHDLDRSERRARQRQQMMVHRLEMLADDEEARIRHQMMDVGDPSGDRVLDRDHAERRLALAHRGERVLELRAGQRFHLRKRMPAGEVGIGAGRALEGEGDFSFLRRIISRFPRESGGPGLPLHRLRPWVPAFAGKTRDNYHVTASPRQARGRGRGRPGVSTCTPSCAGSIEAHRHRHAVLRARAAVRAARDFEHAARQRDEAVERLAAIGVEPDMLVMRPFAPRHRSPSRNRARAPAAPGRQTRRRPC
jgi:hypothetical protein